MGPGRDLTKSQNARETIAKRQPASPFLGIGRRPCPLTITLPYFSQTLWRSSSNVREAGLEPPMSFLAFLGVHVLRSKRVCGRTSASHVLLRSRRFSSGRLV